ncbi:MAG: cytochrome c peroxidase, partial [Myxococcota bacterium]
MKNWLGWIGVGLCCVACGGEIEAIDPAPALETLSVVERSRIELGRDLFFDPGLSGDGTIACASCHAPAQAGAGAEATSTGIGGARTRRNSPTVFNVGFKEYLFWDGRAQSLEEQALGPLFDAGEMGASEKGVLNYLERYRERFARSFPEEAEPLSLDTLARSLSDYQRQLVTPSRVDAYLKGDVSALSAQEVAGLERFQDDCTSCHDGPGVGGRDLRELGEQESWPAERSADLGRFEHTGDDDDRLVFAVPILRNVSRTAPYFHDGSVTTLEEAIRL